MDWRMDHGMVFNGRTMAAGMVNPGKGNTMQQANWQYQYDFYKGFIRGCYIYASRGNKASAGPGAMWATDPGARGAGSGNTGRAYAASAGALAEPLAAA